MIFIRVDGANIEGIGTGHLYRMMQLSDHLYKQFQINPTFVIIYQETKNMLKRGNYKYVEINAENETTEILNLSNSDRKDILIVDMCDRDDEFIKKLVEKYNVISFDDAEGGARLSDAVINSVVHNTSVDRRNYYFGAEYFLIRPEIGKYNIKRKTISDSVQNLLISLGGSDPCFVSLKLIDWLEGLEFSGKIQWVLGPSVENKQDVLKRMKNLNLDILPLIDYKDMGKLYYQADLCVGAAGFGLYEAACVGLPVITVCLYPHQIKTARKFEEKRCIVNLGYYKEIKGKSFKSSLYKLFEDQPLRSAMSKNGKVFVDGMGIKRVTDIISEFI